MIFFGPLSSVRVTFPAGRCAESSGSSRSLVDVLEIGVRFETGPAASQSGVLLTPQISASGASKLLRRHRQVCVIENAELQQSATSRSATS